MALTLYHKDRSIGEITMVSQEGSWMTGRFSPKPAAKDYVKFFAYMVNENNTSEDPPFDEVFLNPDNWYVEENGNSRGIEVPAVHLDGSIEWRWR